MVIEVLHFSWAHDGGVLEGGKHEIDKPSAKFLGQVAAAAACSDPPVRVVKASQEERGKIDKAVQSQAEGEKAYAKAQKDGDWHEGNLRAHIAATEARLKDAEDLHDDDKGRLLAALASSEDILEHVEAGKSYDEAVELVKGGN